MNALFFILWATDFIMFAFAVESTVTNGVSGMVLFASEVSFSIIWEEPSSRPTADTWLS